MLEKQSVMLIAMQQVREAAETAILELLHDEPGVWRLHAAGERAEYYSQKAKAFIDDALKKSVK